MQCLETREIFSRNGIFNVKSNRCCSQLKPGNAGARSLYFGDYIPENGNSPKAKFTEQRDQYLLWLYTCYVTGTFMYTTGSQSIKFHLLDKANFVFQTEFSVVYFVSSSWRLLQSG